MSSATLELTKEEADVYESEGKEQELVLDENYLHQSFCFMKDALEKGCDVAQLGNGDLMITETKVITHHYRWDEERNRFERSNAGSRRQRKIKV